MIIDLLSNKCFVVVKPQTAGMFMQETTSKQLKTKPNCLARCGSSAEVSKTQMVVIFIKCWATKDKQVH